MKASSKDGRFLDDSLPKGEWEQVWLDEVETGVECEASVPHKPHSAVCALSEAWREVIAHKLRVQIYFCVRAFQSQLREWIRRGLDWGRRDHLT